MRAIIQLAVTAGTVILGHTLHRLPSRGVPARAGNPHAQPLRASCSWKNKARFSNRLSRSPHSRRTIRSAKTSPRPPNGPPRPGG
jgi:hypothetical protein